MGNKYTITDAIIFALVMEDESICKRIIERIFLGRKVKDLKIKDKGDLDIEHAIITIAKSKSVRLDVSFEDSDTWYDIEMQVENSGNLAKRMRYYGSMMDVKSTEKGQDYSELKDNCIIFICCFDYFGRDEAIYEFEYYDKKKDLRLKDGSYRIMLNTSCSKDKIPKELRTLYDYISDSTVSLSDSLIKDISSKVESYNGSEEVASIMTLYEEMELQKKWAIKEATEQGIEQGIAQGSKQAKNDMVFNAYHLGLDLNTISKISGLSIENVKEILNA